jgi:aspartyl-tRNA(Asn)/glutamyl-tRNA(Gln) amidotransferase subunit A
MADRPVWALDAWEVADGVRSGELEAAEVLEAIAERIEQHDEELNAFTHLDLDSARKRAEEIDRAVAEGQDPGPLAGVPLGIKDLEDAAGMPTTKGSVPYKDKVAAADGVQTSRLRQAGAVIVGKTHSPEFGSTAYTRTFVHGTTHNPWKIERTPGGSSGGSAAAVAAALLPVASASDGGGSIRIPASYSGLVGAKGTFGRIPKGDAPEGSLTSVLGCVSRSVRDTARYWDCVVGPHETDAHSLPHPGLSYEALLGDVPDNLRVTWSGDLGFGTCTKEIAKVAGEAARVLAKAADMRWEDRDVELRDPGGAWGLVNQPGMWLDVKDFWPERADDFTPPVRAGVKDAEKRYNLDQAARAIERRHLNNQLLAEVFEDVDIILTPTTATTAFDAEGPMPTSMDGNQTKPMHAITFTYPFNMSLHPAVTVPCGLDSGGLPIGLQIVGRRHEDHVLLQLAAAFEKAQPWPKIATAYAQ